MDIEIGNQGETMPDGRWLPEGIDGQALLAAVRWVLDQEVADLETWECQSIYQPRVASTHGVYLFTGMATDGPRQLPWLLVLKVLTPTPDGTLPLEASLYQSGFLASLRHGLVAPRCFGVVALSDGRSGMWLEHIHDSEGSSWPTARFGITAYHLGTFNATLTRQSKDLLWLSLPRLAWGTLIEACAAHVVQLQKLEDHPLVRRAYPLAVPEGLASLWEARHRLLDRLARTPHLVAHGDAQRRNLFAGSSADGQPCTVAIDWANMGIRPVAADIVTLIHQALMYFDVDASTLEDLDQHMFTQYLSGLSAGGWQGEKQEVRFAYATQLSLGLGLLELGWVLRVALDESRQHRAEELFNRPLDQVLDRRAVIGQFQITLAQEAVAFLDAAS